MPSASRRFNTGFDVTTLAIDAGIRFTTKPTPLYSRLELPITTSANNPYNFRRNSCSSMASTAWPFFSPILPQPSICRRSLKEALCVERTRGVSRVLRTGVGVLVFFGKEASNFNPPRPLGFVARYTQRGILEGTTGMTGIQ